MKYKINGDYVLRDIVDECMVVPVKGSCANSTGFIALNETGKLIMRAIEKNAEESEIIDILCEEYSVSRETAAADAAEFIGKFLALGIIAGE